VVDNAARFFSLLFVALALGPSLAHLLELPNKIDLPREEYFAVQQIYRGWALLGVLVVAELAATASLVLRVRRREGEFAPALSALLCLVAAQALFWTLTFPANQATQNWTFVPENWMELRAQWEYSHAAAALLNMVAFVALLASVLRAARYARCCGRSNGIP
jgi:hypothetical protein